MRRFTVNVIVDNAETKGAPVVFESNPTYLNLFGRIENKILYGMAMTDFTMIRGGSVHKANGGYLVIDALDLLRNRSPTKPQTGHQEPGDQGRGRSRTVPADQHRGDASPRPYRST